MAKVSFSIAYDGPALVDGTMDVRDLAPALLSMGQLLEGACTALYGNDPEIRVSVSATGSGSFQVLLDLASGWNQFVDLFTGESVEALNNLLGLVLGTTTVGGAIVGGLFHLYKKIKGRKATKIESLGDGRIAINVGKDRLEIKEELFRIYNSPDVRSAVEKIVRNPLKREGITECRTTYSNETITVSEEEADYFSAISLGGEDVIESSRRVALKILTISFKTGNKWRLSDGESQIYVEIADEDFLDRVENNQVSFSKGDTLICDVKTTQTMDNSSGSLRATHVIERVVEHKHIQPPGSQLEIPNDK